MGTFLAFLCSSNWNEWYLRKQRSKGPRVEFKVMVMGHVNFMWIANVIFQSTCHVQCLLVQATENGEAKLVTENNICRLEIRELSCDISFEINTFRLKSRRSALENDSKMACRMYKRDKEPSRIRRCRVMQKRSKRKYLNWYCFDLSKELRLF